MANHFAQIIIVLTVTGLVAGCEQQSESEAEPPRLEAAMVSAAMTGFMDYALLQNQKSLVHVTQLGQLLTDFLETPTPDQQQRIQQAWQAAHDTFLAGQLTFLVNRDNRQELTFALDAWPIQAGFLDSLPGYPDSGLVNDVTVEISAAELRRQHGITDSEEVCLGFHAIEYLIFARPVADFIATGSGDTAAELVLRRRQILAAVATQLVLDSEQMSLLLEQQADPAVEQNPFDQLLNLLQMLRHHLLAIVEKNSYEDPDFGHSVYTGSSSTSLGTELTILKALTLDQESLMSVFTVLNPTTAIHYESTLHDAIRLATQSDSDANQTTRLPLTLLALMHQFEEFETALEQRSAQ